MNGMRVISGTAGRLQLVTPKGMEVRPTTDRIKETLFNILAPDIYGCDFLDLFAGSGGIGIEALSRGANSCVFVENGRESRDCIMKNLETTKLKDKAVLRFSDAVSSIGALKAAGFTFDIIFMDPPYNNELERRVLEQLELHRLLRKDGRIIVEASENTDFSYIDDTCFKIIREKKYGSNKHIFIAYR